MLADHQIKAAIESGEIYVNSYDVLLVQPASLEMRLGSTFRMYGVNSLPIDPEWPDPLDTAESYAHEIVIYPGQFLLGQTQEMIGIGDGIGARVEGKSTLGRLGLIVHSTAGFVDPGFKGHITLEMANINTRPIILRAGMKICQMAFYRMDAPVERPYGHEDLGSHYQGQVGVTPAAALI